MSGARKGQRGPPNVFTLSFTFPASFGRPTQAECLDDDGRASISLNDLHESAAAPRDNDHLFGRPDGDSYTKTLFAFVWRDEDDDHDHDYHDHHRQEDDDADGGAQIKWPCRQAEQANKWR